MNVHQLGRISGAIILLALAGSFSASADEPLVVELATLKVVAQPDGEATFAPAEAARPGEELDYVATYRNASAHALGGLTLTLPIPPGVEYAPTAAHPAPAAASVDGQQFAPAPLTRLVRQADGALTEELVPPREYRALRWTVAALEPAASVTVRARARVAEAAP